MRRAPRRFYFHLSGALDLFRFGVSHLAHSFSFRFRIALRCGTQSRNFIPESRQFLPDFFSLPLGGFASPRPLGTFPPPSLPLPPGSKARPTSSQHMQSGQKQSQNSASGTPAPFRIPSAVAF